jgi:diguanylate cyclase (GGDEF)-like protein
MKDQLTGIYNRRYIFNRLKKEMYYSIKMKFKLSILMIDIDDFKLINDNYGHQEGDKLLKEVAAAITKGLEHRGIAGRYGGDEFLIILPRCNLDKAERIGFEIADRIKLTEVSGKAYNIKFSAGAAEYYGEDINAFIKRVDKLLYVSKKTGKNRINK